MKSFCGQLLIYFLLIFLLRPLFAQVEATDRRDIRRVGSLESYISAYGSERNWDGVDSYRGMDWPAEYQRQDNSVIKRYWIGVQDFTDIVDYHWDHYAVYISAGYVKNSLYPVEIKQTAKFEPPSVLVDGNGISAPYFDDVDEINPDQVPDRIISNVVNTSMGLTLTQTVYAFSQQYHDNYLIKEYTYTNTGNTDFDDDIELTKPLKDIRVGWGTRYSVCWDGAFVIGGPQKWGKYSWATRRGEDYAQHYTETITPDNPIVQWIRAGFQWAGQADDKDFDVIGAPDYTRNGRLRAPHHTGVAILHVDKNATLKEDDPDQPVVLGWHAGDTYPKLGDLTPGDEQEMARLYNTILSGVPYISGGDERYDEKYMETNPSPWTVHSDAGGTNLWVAYGPYYLERGESFTIVEVEGVNGLSRFMCEEIGSRWKSAYDDASDSGPFDLPDGSTTNDKDVFKNEWVYTGKDSIMLTFSRAKRNYDLNFEIPQPPMPPPVFEVVSGGDRITLRWEPSLTEGDPDFGGYRLYRAVGKPDTMHYEIFSCGEGTANPVTHIFEDTDATRGFSYYYYITAFNKGMNNNTNANPHGSLHSSSYYTRTIEPAFLRRQAGTDLDNIRIVPNPYYIKASSGLRFPEEEDKIMFYNIPKYCSIKIYTERGDLVKTIEHTDGSGDEAWNSVTDSRQIVVSGVYIAYIEVSDDIHDDYSGELVFKKGESTTKKFIVIR